MEFALQVLFQTFFLEVSRAGISVRTRRTFCGRLYTKNSMPSREMLLVWCGGALLVRCWWCGGAALVQRSYGHWCSAAIGTVRVTGTVRVHVKGMVRMHTGNTATHPRQCGTNGTPVRAKGRRHPSAPTSAPTRRQCGARTMRKQVAQ